MTSEKELNKAYTFGHNRGVKAYYNEQLCTVELPEAVFEYILSLVPTEETEREPCDDAISREELLKAIDTWDKFGYTETGCFVREPKGDYIPYIHFDDVIKCIKGMPSVTQKSGEWIKWWEVIKHERSEEYISHWKCSVCGKEQDPHSAKFINFCPRCGAEMVEPQESEDKE